MQMDDVSADTYKPRITVPKKKDFGIIETSNPFSHFIKDLPYDSKGAAIIRPMIRSLIRALVDQGMLHTKTYEYFAHLLGLDDKELLTKMHEWRAVILPTNEWVDQNNKSLGKHVGLKLAIGDNMLLDLLHLTEFLPLRMDNNSHLGKQIKSLITTHFVEQRTKDAPVTFSKPLEESKTVGDQNRNNVLRANQFLYQCLLLWFQNESPLSSTNVRLHSPRPLQLEYFFYLYHATENTLVEHKVNQPDSPHIHLSPTDERHFLFEGFKKPSQAKHHLKTLGRHLSEEGSLFKPYLQHRVKNHGPTATALTVTAAIAISNAKSAHIPGWGKKALAACALLFSGVWLYRKAAELKELSSPDPKHEEQTQASQESTHQKRH